MDVLDCTTKFTKTSMNKFRKIAKGNVLVNIRDANIAVNIDSTELKKIFAEFAIDCADIDEVILCTDDIAIVTTGKLYKSRCTKDWADYLFDDKQTEKTTTTSTDHVILQLKYKDEDNMLSFEGTKQDAAKWLDETLLHMQIDSFFKKEIVCKLNDHDFASIEQLKKEGYIK